MNTQTKEFTSNKDMDEFISSIELESVRSLVTDKFINLVCNQSQASNATIVLHQLILLNESVKSAIKVQVFFTTARKIRQCRLSNFN